MTVRSHTTTADDNHRSRPRTGITDRAPGMPPPLSRQGRRTITSEDTIATEGSAGQPARGTALPWEEENLDYGQTEGDACHPRAEAEHAPARDLDPLITQRTDGEQLTLGTSTQLLLQQQEYMKNETSTVADVIFGLVRRRTPRSPPPTTMEHPSQWHYLATLYGTYGRLHP